MAGLDRSYFSNLYKPNPNVLYPQSNKTSPTQSAYDTYGTAARQQGEDYSNIMNKYNDVYNEAGGAGGRTFDFNFNATAPIYQTTQDYKDSFGRLSDLSKTGGFSPEDIANIRARAISPIRAIYANANRNVSRQRSLQGGYSPNFAAATAKMARESSNQISDVTTNANADIAGRVAANKLASAGPLANLAAGEQSSRNDFALRAAEFMKSIDMAKLQNQMQMFDFPIKTKLSALEGMRGTYGTTPGATSFMGRQALDTAELQRNINNDQFGRGLQTIGMYR